MYVYMYMYLYVYICTYICTYVYIMYIYVYALLNYFKIDMIHTEWSTKRYQSKFTMSWKSPTKLFIMLFF